MTKNTRWWASIPKAKATVYSELSVTSLLYNSTERSRTYATALYKQLILAVPTSKLTRAKTRSTILKCIFTHLENLSTITRLRRHQMISLRMLISSKIVSLRLLQDRMKQLDAKMILLLHLDPTQTAQTFQTRKFLGIMNNRVIRFAIICRLQARSAKKDNHLWLKAQTTMLVNTNRKSQVHCLIIQAWYLNLKNRFFTNRPIKKKYNVK